MAIMWDARSETNIELEDTSSVAWRLHFAQLLAKSGFDPAVIKEAVVWDDALTAASVEHEPLRDAA
jgi:hypothetical protein